MQMRSVCLAMSVAFALTLPASAGSSSGPAKDDLKTIREGIDVLDSLAKEPAAGIPHELFGKADCILIFPSVAKTAFEVGAKGGRGVASCRQPDGQMGPPALFTIAGASVDFKIYGMYADVVMLVMNEDGIKNLVSDRFTIGKTTATAGPVGRTAQASTAAQTHAPILSWSRCHDEIEGMALDGSVVKPNKDANERLYGMAATGTEILVDSKLAVPASAQSLLESLRRQMAATVSVGQAGTK